MTKEIYVLVNKWYDDNTCVECAFTTKDAAQKAMMQSLNQEISDICDSEELSKPEDVELNDSDNTVFGKFGDYIYLCNSSVACIEGRVEFIIKTCDLFEEKKVVYLVSNIEKHEGMDAEFFNLGRFDTLEEAQKAVERQFNNDLACLDSDEDNEDGWTKRETDDIGSFVYEFDYDSYYEYRIESRFI